MQVPTRKKELQNRKKTDNYVTPAAIKKMKRELKELLKRRPKIIAEVQRTGAFGDFSENAEYQTAKAELRRINDRITILETRINDAVPIKKKYKPRAVDLGTNVKIKTGDQIFTYNIVGPQESNPSKGLISYKSPLGEALLHHGVGDIVKIDLCGKTKIYEILDIE